MRILRCTLSNMNWLNGFELMCYALSVILIWDMARKKNISELKLFLSGCIAGYTLELLAVRVTDIYYYNPQFWLNLGTKPYQFPVFGGLMWGGLTVCALRISKRLSLSKVNTALLTGFLIVSMDILLDVAAIRLNNGFWTWEGRAINLEIDHHMFMSVIWVNFFGYMLETPMVTFLSLRDSNKDEKRPIARHILAAILNALGGIGFVGAGSLLALWLNSITDEWFSCVAFILIWAYVFIVFVKALVSSGKAGRPEILAAIFFAAMYIYCFAGLGSLEILKEKPVFAIYGVIIFALTMLAGVINSKVVHSRKGLLE